MSMQIYFGGCVEGSNKAVWLCPWMNCLGLGVGWGICSIHDILERLCDPKIVKNTHWPGQIMVWCVSYPTYFCFTLFLFYVCPCNIRCTVLSNPFWEVGRVSLSKYHDIWNIIYWTVIYWKIVPFSTLLAFLKASSWNFSFSDIIIEDPGFFHFAFAWVYLAQHFIFKICVCALLYSL